MGRDGSSGNVDAGHVTTAARGVEDTLRHLADSLPVVVFRVVLWPDRTLEYVSAAIGRILGWMPADVAADLGTLRRFVHPEDQPVVEHLFRRPEELVKPFVVRFMHADGGVVWCETRCSLERDGDRIVAVSGVVSDVSPTLGAEAVSARAALHDPVTGLPKLALFREHVHHAFGRRITGIVSPALLVARIDAAERDDGDRDGAAAVASVVGLAGRISAAMGSRATVGRTGETELALLFEDLVEAELPVRAAEELAGHLSEGSDHATASIGIAYARTGDSSSDDLLAQANAAMELARSRGGNRYEISDSDLGERVGRRLRIEADLRMAIEKGEFVLVYQPEVSLATGGTVAVEAFLRWRHPERGLLEPREFLEAAEDSGLMVPVGAWVVEEACRRQAQWARRRSGSAPPVVVNLSPSQLGHPDIVADVAGVLSRTGVAPGALCLDVTEAALAEDAASSLAVLEAFRRLGVRVAVDDFGTGYASLSIVRSFPVDAVKIDRSVVAALDGDSAAAGLCSAVVGLAAGCGLDVSAEGVETESQRDRLVDLGVTRGQGDLFRTAGSPEALGLTLAVVH